MYDVLVKQYKLEKEKQELESSCLNVNKLRNMIREQASQFPVSRNFDYRELFSEVNNTLTLNEDQFDKHFCTDLESFVNDYRIREIAICSTFKSIQKCPEIAPKDDSCFTLLCYESGLLFFTNSTWLSFLYKWASG